ncbi:MAG: hypothetical protein JRI44_13995 [Deltaproteobacteria bacterium]|nr:hypothetical protein [Deltaproteobacteria bacterium]
MARIIIYDGQNRVVNFLPSEHTPLWEGKSNVLINPEGLDELIKKKVPIKYWKVEKGRLLEMTDTEKAQVDYEKQQKLLAEEEVKKDVTKMTDKLLKAAILAIIKKMGYPISDFKADVAKIYDTL